MSLSGHAKLSRRLVYYYLAYSDTEIFQATSITLYPTLETTRFSGSIFCDFLYPYFKDRYRFIQEGDVLKIQCDIRKAEFTVISVQPRNYGIVTHDTEIKVLPHSTENILPPQEEVLKLITNLVRTIDYATSHEYGSGIALCASLIRQLEILLQTPPNYEEQVEKGILLGKSTKNQLLLSIVSLRNSADNDRILGNRDNTNITWFL